MANSITAGNSSNGGTAIVTDTSGTLEIKTGTGSGTTAISIDASQVVTMASNLTVTGTLTATGGLSGGIRSGTAVASTSGTSIDFTSLPTGIKRITVMFNGVSTSGGATMLIQLGTGSTTYTTSGYSGSSSFGTTTSNNTNGFIVHANIAAGTLASGIILLTNVSANIWALSATIGAPSNTVSVSGGSISLAAVLTALRITTTGSDTFDAGTINILYE